MRRTPSRNSIKFNLITLNKNRKTVLTTTFSQYPDSDTREIEGGRKKERDNALNELISDN